MGQEIEQMQQHFYLFFLPKYYHFQVTLDHMLNFSTKLTFQVPMNKITLKPLLSFNQKDTFSRFSFIRDSYLILFLQIFLPNSYSTFLPLIPCYLFSPKTQQPGSNEAFVILSTSQLETQKGQQQSLYHINLNQNSHGRNYILTTCCRFSKSHLTYQVLQLLCSVIKLKA